MSESTVGTRVIDRGDPTIVDKRPIPAAASHPTASTAAQQSIPHATRKPAPQPHARQAQEHRVQEPIAHAPQPQLPAKSAKQRAKANPETAKHLKRSKSRVRWLGPIISLFLMVAAVLTVWFLLTDAGSELIRQITGSSDPTEEVLEEETSEPSGNAATGADGDDLFSTDFNEAGLRTTSFDPLGNDGVEHEEAVSRPFDGDPNTFWLTSRYRDRNFGQIKEGVGLIVEFSEPRSMQDIEIVANRVGWAFDLYAADSAQATLAEWGEPIGSYSNLVESQVIDTDDREVGSLLFWVTDLGLAPDQTVEEYEAEVASPDPLQQIQISQIELVG